MSIFKEFFDLVFKSFQLIIVLILAIVGFFIFYASELYTFVVENTSGYGYLFIIGFTVFFVTIDSMFYRKGRMERKAAKKAAKLERKAAKKAKK